MKNALSLIGLLVLMVLFVRIAIIGPIKRTRIKKQIEENRIPNRIINTILKNKYDVNFEGDYTLMIYDFIKTKVEHVHNDVISYDNFNKNDLLRDIYLDEAYHSSMHYNEGNYFINDKTVEEINRMINASFLEIKYELAQRGQDFPLYNLSDISHEIKELTKEEVELKIKTNRDQYEDEESTIDGFVYIFWIIVIISILIYVFYYWKLGLFIGVILSLINLSYVLQSKSKQEKLALDSWYWDKALTSYL